MEPDSGRPIVMPGRMASPDGSIVILHASAHGAYETLRQWIRQHPSAGPIAVLSRDDAVHLGKALMPQTIHAIELSVGSPLFPLIRSLWSSALSLINRFDTVIVLCVGDEEVMNGHSVYRVLGELLFSRRVVLMGPHAVNVWPGGRGLIRPRRMREITMIVGTIGVGLGTTAVVLAAAALNDAMGRVRTVQ